MREKIAHTAIESLAETFEKHGMEVQKFTPSIKEGRRFLGVKFDDDWYLLTLEVDGEESEGDSD